MSVAVIVKRWTLEELHSLPDDGNKYELIDGDLFVTPPPTDLHETIAARLTRMIDPYVAANELGLVYRPKAVFRIGKDSEVEPDLMVRALNADPRGDWLKAPLPILVVEIGSPSTWRRDRQHKRTFYMEHGVAEYWIVDPDRREVIQIRGGVDDVICTSELTWSPAGATDPFVLEVPAVFG